MADHSYRSRSYEFDRFRVDAEGGLLWRAGEVVPLTPKAFEILVLLIEKNGHVVRKEELMTRVWPDTFVEEANLTNNISLLRKVLQEKGDEQHYIKTVPRRGYRFVANVRELTDESANATSRNSPRSQHETFAPRRNEQATGKISSPLGLPEIRSLAVLPLDNISGDSEQDYFADGMTDALISELAQIGSLRVISRNSIMNYKGARKKTPDIGRELKVDALIEGAVVKSGERVRITVNLIQAATDQHLWSKSYERDLRDVLTLQSEIGRDVTQKIRSKLTPQEEHRLSRVRPINPAAHEAYMKALYWLHQAIEEPVVKEYERLHQKSFEHFDQAINLEPSYAPAHAALSTSYNLLASSGFPQFYPKAKASALKAVALDDNLAAAHGQLAYSLWRYEWNFAEAEREFKKAEELDSDRYLWGYAQFLSTLGRHEEAIYKYRLAQDFDPLTLYLKMYAGQAYLDAQQYDQAIMQFKNVLELDPKQFWVHPRLCVAYVIKGMHEEGVAECQKALAFSDDIQNKVLLAWAFAMAGKRSEAISILNNLKNQVGQRIEPLSLARVYSALGEKDVALAHLEKAYEERDAAILWLKVDSTFESLRPEPRFQDLLRRIGLSQ